jgi:hypothetical protein
MSTRGDNMEQEKPLTPEQETQAKLAAARAHAIGEAMREVMGEQKFEIIKRARAKLVAMGIQLEPEDDNETLS